MFDRIKNLKAKIQTSRQTKADPQQYKKHVQEKQKKAQSLKQQERPALSFPVTNLFIQRSGTRLFKAASVSLQGFPQEQDSQSTFQPRLGGRHDFLFSVLDGHNGATASTSLKGLIESKFAGLKMTNENIMKAFLWFDQQYNSKTMFRDGTTCSMVYGQPWNALTDERVVNLERFLEAYEPGVEQLLRDELDPNASAELKKDRIRVIDPDAGFPDDFVLRLLSVNIGNSKAMLIRPNGNWIAITEDHTCNNRKERNRILKAGGVIVEGKINGRHPVTRSIGDKLFKKLEGVPLLDQMIVPLPDFEEHIMLPGDLLLISCNGLFQGKNMDFSTVAALVADSVKAQGKDFDPAGVLRDLFEVSLEQGSRDNHTATLLHFSNGLKFVQPPLVENELVPGPLPKMQGIDKESSSAPRFRYVKAYVADLMRNGYTLDDVHDYHKAHRDLEFSVDQYAIRPIIFKGDIGKQIQEEEQQNADKYNDDEEYMTHDSKFQYEQADNSNAPSHQGPDPRQTLSNNLQSDSAEQAIRSHNNKTNEPWMEDLRYSFQPDPGSKDNKLQRSTYDIDIPNPFSRSQTPDAQQSTQTRSFFQQLQDSFIGRRH
jgi:serine/threonine protein phosphatase PrpC